MIKIGINGFGRIGRLVFRAAICADDIEVVAVNAPDKTPEQLAYTVKYDSVHGRFNGTVDYEGGENPALIVNGKRVSLLNNRDAKLLPWGELGVEYVLECTGAFLTKEKAQDHLDAGAQVVVLSGPSKDDTPMFVCGVNLDTYTPDIKIVSNASCTTNCLAPVAAALHEAVGIERGLMTTIHSYTNDQVLTDVYHKDMRRARSATHSMIPTKTGAAAAVGLVLPELNGRLDGFAVRVPTINVSFVDLTFTASRDTSVEEINAVMKAAAESPRMKGVLGYNDLPLVSIDFNHDEHSSVFDSTLTKVSGSRLVKVTSWYDNEWGFSNRMLDTACAMMAAK